MSNEWFENDFFNLSAAYKKTAGIIILVLMIITGVLAGGFTSYEILIKEGCNANPSMWLTLGSGFMTILGFIAGLAVVGIVGYSGLIVIPDNIKNIIEDYKRNASKPQVPMKEKLSNAWAWLVERKTGILIVLGGIVALMVSSYLLGYTAWLIVC